MQQEITQEEAVTDQVALDMKLYVRDEIDETDELVKKLLEALQKIMEENVHTYMPGFTHLQKAQPVTLAHHVGAYFEMFVRDRSRLADIRKRMNTCSGCRCTGRNHLPT